MQRFTPLQAARMHAEIERCLSARHAPIVVLNVCRTTGDFGTAFPNEICLGQCSQGRIFPNGVRNFKKARWCSTVTKRWGGRCRCMMQQVLPDFTFSPTPQSSVNGTVGEQGSHSPSVASGTQPTITQSPATIHIPCSSVKGKEECKRQTSCRYLGLNNAKTSLPETCSGFEGCRSALQFCNGLCKEICRIKRKFCVFEDGICRNLA